MAVPGADGKFGDATEPIAIVGLSCRFPGHVSSPQQFWEMLVNGRSGHCEIPADRFNASAWQHPNHDRKGAIQPTSGFFLDQDVSLFDAPFFSITAKEAMGMDPMQRQLLEIAYECFENAGVPLEKLSGSSTSVYTGVMTNDYERFSQSDTFDLPQNAASGTSRAMLSNRLSWFFNLSGPSLTLDTACSSSLYALHLACQSLRLGESQQALVTGVNLILHPNFISQLSAMHMLSPDGISHSFDERANGYARGEAIGAVLVKPLSRALADGDTIRAVIRGSGANQDGKTPGITMPSGEAQANLIKSTYSTAGLTLADTSYFEAHGTGTKIGDPIELSAIGASFGALRAQDDPLYVGSVKMNVGHTEGMAGLAGVIKATLSLENAILPGLVGFEKLNPKLLLDTWRLALPLETMPWPVKGLRRASVNSFGFGGANAHLIIDDAYHYLKSRGLDGRHRTAEAPPLAGSLIGSVAASQERTPSKNYKLLPFSMHDQNGLDRLSKTLAAYLSLNPLKGERPEVDLEDLAFTLATRRSHFGIRSFAVSQTIEDLAANDLSSLTSTKQKRRGQPENIIFVFTGQGAQWPLMGRELLTHPSFSSSIARSQQYLDELGCTWSAVELLHDPGPKINIPAYCQPICTILQVALVDLLASWGVTPRATVGHSSGEIAAAYAAGGINHRDAVKIAYMRGYYCGQIQIRLKEKRGAMLAAGLTTQEAQQYIDDLVSDGSVVIGCVNSPTSVTLSGDIEGISHLEERIKIDGKFARKLRVDVAYHSPHMHSVSEDFLESLRTIEVSDNFKVPMFSSVTTKQLDKPDQLNAAYWVMNMVSAVRFSEAVNSLLKYSTVNPGSKRKIPVNWVVALELGPHEALKGPFNQCASAIGNKRSDHLISYTSLIRRGEPADKSAAEAAGLLWSLGHSIDVLGVNNFNESRKQKLMTLTDLPPYPWKHTQGFWHEPSASMSARLRPSPRTDLLGLAVDNQNSHEPHWRNLLSVSENPWTRDHAITGTILYPAAGMLIMALEAALQIAAAQEKAVRGVEFHNVNFERGLVILDIDEAVETSLSLRPHETLDWWFHWVVYSRPPGGTWIRHSFGLLTLVDDYDDAENGKCWLAQTKEFDSIKARATTRIDSKAFYTQLETIGMGYGPTFTNLTMAAVIEGEQAGHGTIAIPDTKSTMPSGIEYPHVIHPATLDAIFHLIFIALFEGKPMGEAAIPVTMEKMFVAINQPAGAGAEFVGFCTGRKINDRDSSGSLVVSDLDWSAPKVSVNNMIVRKVSSPSETATSRSEGQMTRLPQRVAELHWLEDVDLLDLASANRVVELESKKLQLLTSVPIIASAVGWLNLACHKKASLTAVVVADTIQSADIFAELVSGFAPASGVERRLAKVSIIATTDAVHGYLASHSKLQDPSSSFELLAPANTATVLQHETNEFFDLLIFHSELHSQPNNNFVANWTSQLKSDGRILVLGTGVDNGSIKASGNTAPSAEHPLRIQGFEKILVWVANTDSTLLVASRPLEVPSREQDVIYILQSADVSSRLIHFRQQLDRLFESKGIKLETKLLSDVKELSGRKIISLLESEEPLVIKWSAEQFEQFRDLVLSQSYVLWVTKGGIIEAGETSLQFAPTTGLLRAIRTEIPQIVLPHMDLSPSIDLEASLASDLVWTVFNATSESKTSAGDGVETEFAESNGSLLIPRIFGNATLDEEVNAHAEQPRPISSLLSAQHGRPVKLVDEGPSSSLTQLHWVEDLDAVAPIGSDEVEVRTKYAALEAGELDTKRSTSQQASVGRTASGIILRIGANVRDLEIGDKVFFPVFERGAFRTQLRQQQHLISKLPAGVRLEDAPHLLTILMTAYHALHNIARATSGERVLIHLLNKELRHAAIHIAREKTATVFITVSSVLEKDILLSQYHIDARHIFEPSRDITSSLTAATSGEGFDIIISDHTGASRRQGSLCLAYFGRFIDLSGKVQVSDMDTDIFNKNVSISSVVDLWRLGRPNLENLFQITSKFFGQDIIPTQASTTPIVSISALESIWNHLNETSSPGATVYFDDEAMIPIIPIKSPPVVLDPQATYVIAGGLGALGLTISDNMVTHGARHLVLLSRSGITNSRQQNGVETLKQRGCQVDTVSCDVTDPAQVMEVVKLSQERSWSIKGLIQCAMVLQDSIFENMTFDKWLRATQPKIKGTWNLHQHLPRDLDFFIVLSSMSGIIGNAAQANYAAGNTYEDAVAHYRRAQGLVATTLNVGLVTDASHFTADSTIEDYLKRYGHWASAVVTDREMQTVLEAVMRGSHEGFSNTPTQLLVGINGHVPRSQDGLNPWSKDRKFDHRIQKSAESIASANGNTRSLAEALERAKSGQEAVVTIENALRSHVAAAMTAAAEDIDSEKPLYSFGIDSLKAIQVRNWVFKELKCDISVFDILSPMPLSQLASRLAHKSSLVRPEFLAAIGQEGI